MDPNTEIIPIRIDVTQIDKDRLYRGEKGTYLNAVIFLNAEPDKFGNYGMISQEVSKAEREAGTRGNILGNARRPKIDRERQEGQQYGSHHQQQPAQAPAGDDAQEDDDIPF